MQYRFPWIYYLICCVVYCLALPALLFLCFKKKYRHSLPARFLPLYPKLPFKPRYWFHACSFGESKSYEPILKALLDKEPHTKILLTTTTQTGFNYLQSLAKSPNIEVFYLPFEIFLPLWLPSLQELKSLIVTEAELWKMLFWVGKASHARTLLVNARISDRSYASYKRFAWFYQSLFKLIDNTLAQLPSDQERLQNLGAQNVQVFGNLKIFSTPTITHHYIKTSPIILGASTHPQEERLIFDSFIKSQAKAKLFIAPRHPERFLQIQNELEELCKANSLRFSTLQQEWGDVILVNTLGELNNLYAIADCVILGGSFVPVGGHNPLEPAFFQVPILSGEYFYNQKALYALIENISILSPQELYQKLTLWDTLPKTSIQNSDLKMQMLMNLICKDN